MPRPKISDFFCQPCVYHRQTCANTSQNDAFISVMAAWLKPTIKLATELANQVAAAMKEWAMSPDASQFYPLVLTLGIRFDRRKTRNLFPSFV
ncbi:MAG: glutamine synthetase III [Sphingobacteriales bacterium]|nr:glutamine synthetase III [Sphingobacteriales bacterium]